VAETPDRDGAEPTPAQGGDKGRSPGLREALVVGGLTVLVVLLAAVVTFLLPPEIGNVVFQTPLLIVVLIVGTAAVLLRITRPGPGTR
jgi:uncharacterized membrane protein YbhN (UPF0104 family)